MHSHTCLVFVPCVGPHHYLFLIYNDVDVVPYRQRRPVPTVLRLRHHRHPSPPKHGNHMTLIDKTTTQYTLPPSRADPFVYARYHISLTIVSFSAPATIPQQRTQRLLIVRVDAAFFSN